MNTVNRPPSGLQSIPDTWIAQGRTRGNVTSPYGGDKATVDRSQDKVFINNDGMMSPDITITNLGQGRIKILADMPWPISDLKAEGTADRQGDVVLFKEDKGGTRTGEIRQKGTTVETVLHTPGKEDMWFTFTPTPSR